MVPPPPLTPTPTLPLTPALTLTRCRRRRWCHLRHRPASRRRRLRWSGGPRPRPRAVAAVVGALWCRVAVRRCHRRRASLLRTGGAVRRKVAPPRCRRQQTQRTCQTARRVPGGSLNYLGKCGVVCVCALIMCRYLYHMWSERNRYGLTHFYIAHLVFCVLGSGDVCDPRYGPCRARVWIPIWVPELG